MKKTSGLSVSIAFLLIDALIAAIPVWHEIVTLRDSLVFALDLEVDIVLIWIPLVLCGVIGFFAWLRYKGKRGGGRSAIDFLTALVSVAAVLAVISIGLFKREESRNPVLFQASSGGAVGGLWIQLRLIKQVLRKTLIKFVLP